MFHGSNFDFSWTALDVGGDDRWTPLGFAAGETSADRDSIIGLYAPFLIEQNRHYLPDEHFETGSMLGIYTDKMPDYTQIALIDERYNTKADCLTMRVDWKLKDNAHKRYNALETQKLILIKFERALSANLRVIMNYDKLPLDEPSRTQACVEIPPFVVPRRLNMVTVQPKLQQFLSKPTAE